MSEGTLKQHVMNQYMKFNVLKIFQHAEQEKKNITFMSSKLFML